MLPLASGDGKRTIRGEESRMLRVLHMLVELVILRCDSTPTWFVYVSHDNRTNLPPNTSRGSREGKD
jgi:hypothetical protein